MKKNIYYYTLTGLFLLLGAMLSAQPTISGITLGATTSSFSTNDELSVSYTATGTVETAISWYVDWVPLNVFNFPFEAGSANALIDFSGNGNDLSTSGIPLSTPTWGATSGHNGTGAFSFDGDDYLVAGEVMPLNSSYTKAAWIYLTDENGYRNIISGDVNADRNHGFKINPDGRLNAGHSFGDYYVVDSDSLHNNVWYFVAVTFDYQTGLMILYKDGVEVDRAIVPASNRSIIDASVLIGSKVYSFFLTGEIDDAMLFDRDLSPEQIQNLYTNRGEELASEETRGGDWWRVRVTGFSASVVGDNPVTSSEEIQAPEISGLGLSAETSESLTDEDLTASFTTNGSVTETATAWFRDGNPDALMYLPFEGGNTYNALSDYSGSDNHADMEWDLLSDPTWDATGGHNGSGGFEFDGDDYLMVGDILPAGSSYTKTAWVYSTVLGFNNIISANLHADNNHFLKINADGRLNAGHSFGTAIVADGVPLALDTWYFVAVTFDYDSREMILYKNGSAVSSATVPPALVDVDPSVLIGSMDMIYGWDGNIDEARLYDRALSSQQISAMYAGDNVLVAEETLGGEDFYVEVTPFAYSEANSSSSSNTVEVHAVVVSDITDQTTTEGTTFTALDLDDYVDVYDGFDEGDITWTSSGSSELTVVIDPVSHVVNLTIPGTDWFGSEDITFIATNPNGDSDNTEVAFTVTNVNDEPVLSPIAGQSTNEDVPLTGLSVDFTDADPTDSHTITITPSNSNVVVANQSGTSYDLVPAANWNGSANITVRVTDNGTPILFDEVVYTLDVDAVNDAPELTEIGNQTIDEDASSTGLSVIFSDPDIGDLHTIAVVSDNSNVSVVGPSANVSGSTYDLVPAGDWNGTAQITVTVTDDDGTPLTDTEVYTFTVNAVNDEPVLTDIGDQSTLEDVNLTGLVVAFSDPDATDNHTITVVSSEPNVTMANLSGDISGSTYDLVPAASWNGTAQITVRVTDNGSGTLSDFETYTLTVSSVNNAPVISPEVGDQQTEEDTPLSLTVTFTDVDVPDTHVVTVVSSDPNVTANITGNSYDLVPASNWNGTAQITVRVTDDGVGTLSDYETFTLTVNAVNDGPSDIDLSNLNIDERVALETVVGVFSSADPDVGDTHSYELVAGDMDNDNASFTIDGDELKTAVELNFETKNIHWIRVQSTDGDGESVEQTFVITVNDLDETGVEDIYNKPSFNVYPVPAIDNITVEVDNPDNKELLLEIYSNTGRLVHAEPIYSKNRIDLTGFTDGMYILSIKGEQVYGTRKILVKDR